MRYFLALILSLLPLALGQTPFPIAFSSANAAQLSSSLSSYDSSLAQQPAYTSFASYMATATVSSDASAEFASASNNPLLLAINFFTATATPAWYTEIPAPFQSYVSSVANAEASIASKVLSSGGPEMVEAKVAVMGSLLAAMLVGMLLL